MPANLPAYTFNDGVATITVKALADVKKLVVVRTDSGYEVQYKNSAFQTLTTDTKKVRIALDVGGLTSIQTEIDLGLNIGHVDKVPQQPSNKDTATTSWGALLKDQFHFVWVNGTTGNDTFEFSSAIGIDAATKTLMADYGRGIWVDLKTGNDKATGSDYGDNFSISGSGVRYIDGGNNNGSPPWGGKAIDSVDVFINNKSASVVVQEVKSSDDSALKPNDASYPLRLLVDNKLVGFLKNIESVNVQYWDDKDLNGERDWGSEVQWVRNIQLAVNVGEVRLDPTDNSKTDWGQSLTEAWHLAWINGTKGDDTIVAADLISQATQNLEKKYSHGVWIDGDDGNDTIVGTDYSDNIKGGAGNDKIDGGKQIAPAGQRGQDVFEVELIAADASTAQTLLNSVKVSNADATGAAEGYTWMVEVGTLGSAGYQKDYLKNIESVSINVRDANNNWLSGKWINTALNVGEIRISAADSTKTEWGTPLSEQNHFAWVNGTSADESFDYTGKTPDADTITETTKSLMAANQRGMWVDTGAGNDHIVTSPYSDNISISGSGTKWVDAGDSEGKMPWGEKGRDEVDVFVASLDEAQKTNVVLLTADSVGADKTAYNQKYTYKVQIDGASTPMAYLKNVERVNIQIWTDKNQDGQRQWDANADANEMTWFTQVPLAVQVNEVRVSTTDPSQTEWGQKLADMYHMAWINGTSQADEIVASTLLSDATKSLQVTYKRGIWIDAGAGDDKITATDYADNIRGGSGNDSVYGGLNYAPAGEHGQDVYDIELHASDLASAEALLQRVKVIPSDKADFDWKVVILGQDGQTQEEVDYLKDIEVVNIYINKITDNQWLTGRWQPIALNVGEIRISATDPTKTEWGSTLSEQYHYAWVNGTNKTEIFDFTGQLQNAETVTDATKDLMNRDQRGIWIDMAGGDDQIVASPYGDNIAISGSGVRWIDGGDQKGTDPWGNAPRDGLDVYVSSLDKAKTVKIAVLDVSKDKAALDKSFTAKIMVGDELVAYIKNIEVVNVQIWTDVNDDGLRQWDKDQFQWFGRLTVDVNEVRLSATDSTQTEWGTKLADQWHFAWINGTDGDDAINATQLISAKTKALEQQYSRGVWVDAGAGDDQITGTPYSDDINGGSGNDKVDGGTQIAPAGEQGRDNYQFRIDIAGSELSDAQAALKRLTITRVKTSDTQDPAYGYQWKVQLGKLGDQDFQIDYLRNMESISVSVNNKDTGQWLTGYWKNLAMSVGEIRLDKNNPDKTEWGGLLKDQYHFAWVNGIDEDEVFDYTGQLPNSLTISQATKDLMKANGRGLSVESRGGNDVIVGSPYGDNFSVVAADTGVQYIDGQANEGSTPWGGTPVDQLDVFVANSTEASQVKVSLVAASSLAADQAAAGAGYVLKAVLGDRTLAYLKNVERINIQIWNDSNQDEQRDWQSEVQYVRSEDLAVNIGFPNDRDTTTGTLWVNGTAASDLIDVQALINTLPNSEDPLKNWRGSHLEVNVNAGQGGGDTIIGSNNPDMITPGIGVNYIDGGAQAGNQTWNKFDATYDSLQLIVKHEAQLWKYRNISALKEPEATDNSLDAQAYRAGYKLKVDMPDPFPANGDSSQTHYIKNVEQIGLKVWKDLNGNNVNDWGNEIYNLSFVYPETPEVSWVQGEKGSTTAPPSNFYISGSDFIKNIDANALINGFVEARKAFPVSSSDLPSDFKLASISNTSNSYGAFMMLGSGDHTVTGTDYSDFVLIDTNGYSTINGGADVGYWKYAGAATGSQDTLRLVEKIQIASVVLPVNLVNLPVNTATKAFSNNMTPSNTGDDVSGLYTIQSNDLAAVLVMPKTGRTNLPENIQQLVTAVETAQTHTQINDALTALSNVAQLQYGVFLGVADLNTDNKYESSSFAVLDRVADSNGKVVLGANTSASGNPLNDLISTTSSRYSPANYHLIKLSDWTGYGKSPLTELFTSADALQLRDVFPKDSNGTTTPVASSDLEAISAYAKSAGIVGSYEYALVTYQYDYVKNDFSAVAGVTLLTDIEYLDIRLWLDANFDYRPSGSEYSGSRGGFTLKPNAYVVTPEDLSASTAGGKFYAGSVAGTGMADTLDLKKDYQSMIPANYQAQKLGFKVADLSSADTVTGTDFDDFFALCANNDQLDGGAGSDRVAFWWKPSSTNGDAVLKTKSGSDNGGSYLKIIQVQGATETELARLRKTDAGWTIEHKDQTCAKGYGNNTNFGTDTLVNVEELVVLLDASLKDTSTGALKINTGGVTDTVPFIIKLAPTVDYPIGADATKTSVTFNGSTFADVIDAPALLKTLPSSSVGRDNWQGTTLSTNINLNGGGDKVIGTSNADIVVAASGVNYIDGGANGGRTAWVPNWWSPVEKSYWGLEGAADQLQIFIKDAQDAANVSIQTLSAMSTPDATDAKALSDGYTTKVVYGDSVNYIKNVEYVGKRIWTDSNSNQRKDAGEVVNYAYTPIDDTIINWRAGDIGATNVGGYYFDITASQYVTSINAPALIDRFITNKKTYPVLAADKITLDLPQDFLLSNVIDNNSSYGVFLNAGSGNHSITGTANNDFFVVGAHGSNMINGGANTGYYKYPVATATGAVTGARDTVRITEETSDLKAAVFDRGLYSLIKVADWAKLQTDPSAFIQDILNSRNLGATERQWLADTNAVLQAQIGSDATSSKDFMLIKTSSAGDVIGLDLLKDIERIEWRFWQDVNGDARQGGGTGGYWAEVSDTAALTLELKPNLAVLESADQSYASTASLSYSAVGNGTSFDDTINLQTLLGNLNAAPVVNGLGVKFADLAGNDVVTGSVGNDIFYLSRGNDVLDGGQGNNDRALVYWAPDTSKGNATLSVERTSNSIVFKQSQALESPVTVLTLTKSGSTWSVDQGSSTLIVGHNNAESIGVDQLSNIEQFVVALNPGVDASKATLTGVTTATPLVVDLT